MTACLDDAGSAGVAHTGLAALSMGSLQNAQRTLKQSAKETSNVDKWRDAAAAAAAATATGFI